MPRITGAVGGVNTSTAHHLALATFEDLVRIYTDLDFATVDTRPDVHSELPPPGFELVHNPRVEEDTTTVPLPFIWGEVVGDESTLNPGDLWWTTFAQYALHLSAGAHANLLAKVLTAIGVLPGGFADPAAFPIVYRVAREAHMRWIRNTYRGLLCGGIEEFQFKIDLGNPGNDPDLNDAQLLSLAEQLAGIITDDGLNMRSAISTEHTFTEVGCVMMTATDATDSQGNGGNMQQSGATQWFAYTVGTRPIGASGGVTLPLEVATAVTLQTDHRGPSGRGRYYLPPPGTNAVQAGGTFTSNHLAKAGDGSQEWLEAIRAATPYLPVVVSPRRLILNEITSLNSGSVPDSQRRRRRSQVEARIPLLIT